MLLAKVFWEELKWLIVSRAYSLSPLSKTRPYICRILMIIGGLQGPVWQYATLTRPAIVLLLWTNYVNFSNPLLLFTKKAVKRLLRYIISNIYCHMVYNSLLVTVGSIMLILFFFFFWFTWGVRASLRAPRLFPTAHWTSCKPRSR